ncbi:MAG: L-glutamate gamma-semialdehyde dehydrogenase [Perlabentimonas sp.]
MNNAIFNFSRPENEPIKMYEPCSPERQALLDEVERQSNEVVEIPLIIGGKEVKTGDMGEITMPHDNKKVIARYHKAGKKEVEMAIEAALEARKYWSTVSWVERSSVNLKIAELISKKYRYKLNAATMVGQGKSVFQAEIDSACETIDFLRFNSHFISEIYNQQPHSEPGVVNRTEYRALEGFILAITPFNFTAIGSNLNMSPVLMGNTVVWKPATAALLSNYMLMKIYKEAGLPDGVINFIPGKGSVIGGSAIPHPMLAGIHFTGSTSTFNSLWKQVGENLDKYKSYPKIVGETGGKDFIVVHPSADLDIAATAIVRGAFEYQGQKCSAASRAYVPKSVWEPLKKRMGEMISEIKMGEVNDFENFMNAVIEESAYNKIMGYINKAKESKDAEVIFGGNGDSSKGWYIEPTVVLAKEPNFITMEEEIFGPVLSLYVYDDDKWDETLKLVDETSPYGLTGAVIATDRKALNQACAVLRYAAGNFYFNDKPTGAVVGQQPFGGARNSGTNDKAGGPYNLLRWTSPRTVKETLVPPTDFKYPYMSFRNCEG